MAKPLISAGKRIPLFRPGDKKRTALSAAAMNEIVIPLNAFLNAAIVRGKRDSITITESNVVITLKDSAPSAGSGNGNMNYRGDYSAGQSYSKGDVVRVRSGASQGVWVMVSETTVSGTAPAWPEPKDANPSDTNTWELLSLGVKQYTGCKGGANKTFYVQMLES